MDRRAVSGMPIILLLIGILSFTFNIQRVEASGTIYIRADGSIDPPTAPIERDGDLYTLTADIFSDMDGISIERNNMTLDGANHMLRGSGTSYSMGVSFTGRSNVTIKDLTIKEFTAGIDLDTASNSQFYGNNLVDNWFGITLKCSSRNNSICGNNVTNNKSWGINLYDSSSNNIILGNIVADNEGDGISLDMSSSNNSICGNNVIGNRYGIRLWYSPNNSISENNVASSEYGIYIRQSSNNTFYHNNFVSNLYQVYTYTPEPSEAPPTNIWDDGYPSGGNYWSDYDGIDLYRGQSQNETGYDGVGDTPCIIDANNTDNYPLIHPYSSVRNLNTSLTYLTIQSAIDASETLDGHTISVSSETYYETVHVKKGVSLVGEDKDTTVIDGNNTGTVIHITSSNSIVTGFTVQNGGGPYPMWVDGFYLDHVNTCKIFGNKIRNNEGGGIVLEFSSKNNLTSNAITDNKYGVYMARLSNHNILSKNRVANNTRFSISLWVSSNYNTLSRNYVETNQRGIYIQDSSNNSLSENFITRNNEHGISLRRSHSNTLYHNNFVSNTQQTLISDSFNTTWDAGYPLGGNYWSDYSDVDVSCGPNQDIPGKDGIWDSPYVIAENNTDNYPLVKPYVPGNLSVSIFTDKDSYSAGDTMHLGLNVANPDSVKYLCFAIWCELPDSPVYLLVHEHSVILPIGFTYASPSFKTIVLPSLPSGTYTWHAAFLERATHTILVEDTAEWEFK